MGVDKEGMVHVVSNVGAGSRWQMTGWVTDACVCVCLCMCACVCMYVLVAGSQEEGKEDEQTLARWWMGAAAVV